MLEILDVALGDTAEWRAVDEGSMVGLISEVFADLSDSRIL